MYSDWYVLHTTSGKEQLIKSKIEKYSDQSIQMKIFQREMIHTHKGEKIKMLTPLFYGYIFVYRNISEVCKIIKQHLPAEYVHPVSLENKPCRIYREEMDLLLKNTNTNGILPLSRGLKTGDKIEITDGALKNLAGNIVWIDEKKKKARVEIWLFNKKMRINLGLEIFDSSVN